MIEKSEKTFPRLWPNGESALSEHLAQVHNRGGCVSHPSPRPRQTSEVSADAKPSPDFAKQRLRQSKANRQIQTHCGGVFGRDFQADLPPSDVAKTSQRFFHQSPA